MSAVSVSEITAPFRPLLDYSSLSPYALSAITLPEYKNPDFVLEMPENGGSEGRKRTKTSILCSGRGGLAPGREEISIAKHNNGLPANHRARFKNISS